MPAMMKSTITVGILSVLSLALAACDKPVANQPKDSSRDRADARRKKAACASQVGYEQIKGILFDEALRRQGGDRTNLDTLADYSLLRMENPVVVGSDSGLDITHCSGRLVLQIPPGAERAFGGQRNLQTSIDYTAQATADGSGLVYRLKGGESVVAQLATFNMTSVAYRPPPAIDNEEAGADGSKGIQTVAADAPAALPATAKPTLAIEHENLPPPTEKQASANQRASTSPRLRTIAPKSRSRGNDAGASSVIAFYNALNAGDGQKASAQIIPEKRSSGAFSPKAMSRFYGGLAEPLQLESVDPAGDGKYRVTYRYSAGRSRCNGSAIVSITIRDGEARIRSIRALNGC